MINVLIEVGVKSKGEVGEAGRQIINCFVK